MRRIALLITACLMLVACADKSRRQEIEQRKAALTARQDSALRAAQAELAIVDSALEATKNTYDTMKKEVEAHRADLTATEDELRTLNLLRQHRDSLQVRFDVLCAKIRYIHKKQKE